MIDDDVRSLGKLKYFYHKPTIAPLCHVPLFEWMSTIKLWPLPMPRRDIGLTSFSVSVCLHVCLVLPLWAPVYHYFGGHVHFVPLCDFMAAWATEYGLCVVFCLTCHFLLRATLSSLVCLPILFVAKPDADNSRLVNSTGADTMHTRVRACHILNPWPHFGTSTLPTTYTSS